ncbi:MAG: nucleoside-diphosphate sugar epimerase/dehydratase [Candidatus Muiribacteriota bacterium]
MNLYNLKTIFLDIAAIVFAFFLTLILNEKKLDNINILYYSIFFRITLLYVFKTYSIINKYINIKDIYRISAAITVSTIFLVIFNIYDLREGVAETCLIIILIVFMRTFHKVFMFEKKDSKTNILIYGAGDAGEMICREIEKHSEYNLRVKAFIDDNKEVAGKFIRGIKIEGSRKKIPELIDKFDIKEIIVAIPSASSTQVSEISAYVSRFNVSLKVLPSESELVDGTVSLKVARNFDLNDILRKKPHKRNIEGLRNLIKGKKVLVTGAGGSIGYELTRQILEFEPALMVAFGHGENSIFRLERDFLPLYKNLKLKIGDIKDKESIRRLINLYNFDIVFHAAAHKHVGLMEMNPDEAVLNNIFGSMNLFELCGKNNVSKVVFVSTDKAVNPQNIMGMTKRVCEKAAGCYNKIYNKTNFISVRFGNVIGSRGSVIPIFQEQIEKGGPVTVTDEKCERFFMSIGEAVQLTLEAAIMGKSSQLFVLEMGEPVKIIDIARKLIALYGYKPDSDIKIEFTGMKNGEKLNEKLFNENEKISTTSNEKIYVTEIECEENYLEKVRELEKIIDEKNHNKLIDYLKELI